MLSLIELFDGELGKLRLQKLLFLYSKRKQSPEYDFVPYKYGCYSYSAKADIDTMIKKGQLLESEKSFTKTDKVNYFQQLKDSDQKLLNDILSEYGHMSSSALIKHTYLNFPFYAIKSEIASEVLPGKLYDRVSKAIPNRNDTVLFTIGYEGISLEKYLLKLIKEDIKVLVDVRKNPLSMKFGFSKSLLKRYCNSLGIDYVHFPEVGIISDKRRSLDTQKDYDILFSEYRDTTLQETKDTQNDILQLLKKHKRIALTCFEAETCQCHRTHLANSITKLPTFEYQLVHL